MAETNLHGSTISHKSSQHNTYEIKSEVNYIPTFLSPTKRIKQSAILKLYFQNLLPKIDKEFRTKKIPFWIIKGPAIAHRYYSNPHLRNYTDVDIFVEPHNWDKALLILRELGGNLLEPKKWMGNQFRQTYLFEGFPIEIHKNLLVSRPIDMALIERSRSTKIPEVKWAQEPGPEDLFIYLCGHGAFQHLFDEIQWLEDLHYLLLSEEKNLDWNYLFARTQNMGLNRAVGVSLTLLKEYFDHHIPDFPRNTPWYLQWSCKYFLSPTRLRQQSHLRPRWLYLFYKALMRDTLFEVIKYSWSRMKK